MTQTSDIPVLCNLLESLFSQEAEFKPDRDLQAQGLRSVIENDNVGDILVARDNGNIVAMVNILYTVSTALGARVGILENMVVSDAVRGSGIGSQLLEQALIFAKEKGCQRITLLTDHDNTLAHTFYQKHGFDLSTVVVFRQTLDF
ncbi:GNAT family N-acetyltransferase [Oceanospirillum sediminis]|uniref:GNAT family N-acetyltransferase n=1 Tax=Oceanospirillum sediminis TaxID=2760088 RepID=A0A839IMX2_9GAMM|nr:GNAT family N-acetyltransferase [Oceanospirillum sediminis]